jgi:exodeoxyribonuclease VII large subunit
MFKNSARNLKFVPEDGVEVLIYGKVDLYEPHGTYQVIVADMEPAGIGALYYEFEQLKKKLEQKGYFDIKHKKPLPYLPKKIGIATSLTGAAVRDMVSILKDRFSNISILVVPTLCQGNQAAKDIVDSINILDNIEDVDLIIIGRGGGSIEDLWCFNEEIVAEAIFNAKTPIISAVGHETDFTISDFVADKRAATPTDAARIAVVEKKELTKSLDERYKRLETSILNKINFQKKSLKLLDIMNFKRKIEDLINNKNLTLANLTEKMSYIINRKIEINRSEIEKLIFKINAMNPFDVLKRGYSVVTNKENKSVKLINDVKIDEIVNIKVQDGKLICSVKDKIKD